MKKTTYLDHLYYDLNYNKDFSLQWQQKEPERMSKRKSYTELCFEKNNRLNQWWIERINARTILVSEICCDYDLKKGWTKIDMFKNLDNLKLVLEEYKSMYSNWEVETYIFDTTSNGIHIHIFNQLMHRMTYEERKNHRLEWFERLVMYKQIDGKIDILYPERQKISENVTINLEYATHWKTGKIKCLIK